jgi:hypothetical protein
MNRIHLATGDPRSPARMPLAVKNSTLGGGFSKKHEGAVPEQPRSPMKAIPAKCVDCSGGSLVEVRECAATGCSLWPLRMGTNPNKRRAAR